MMIDILVYLFENYLPDACPPSAVLAKKLSAAGFENQDISAALTWLEGLAGLPGEHGVPCRAARLNSMRIFDEREIERLSLESRGFISFLEHNAALSPELREAVIERALALPDAVVGLDRLKVIVLAVIWRYRYEIDALILEELLAEDVDEDEFETGEDIARIRLN
jgi:Smg protein